MKSGGQKRPIEEGLDLLSTLREAGLLSENDVLLLSRFVCRWLSTPFDAILESHVMSESLLADAIAHVLKCQRTYVISYEEIDSQALLQVPFKVAYDIEMVALRHEVGSHLRLMVVDPTRRGLWEILRRHVSIDVEICICERRLLRKCIQEVYPIEAQLPGLFIPQV